MCSMNKRTSLRPYPMTEKLTSHSQQARVHSKYSPKSTVARTQCISPLSMGFRIPAAPIPVRTAPPDMTVGSRGGSTAFTLRGVLKQWISTQPRAASVQYLIWSSPVCIRVYQTMWHGLHRQLSEQERLIPTDDRHFNDRILRFAPFERCSPPLYSFTAAKTRTSTQSRATSSASVNIRHQCM